MVDSLKPESDGENDPVVVSDEDEDAPTFGEDGNVKVEATVTAEKKTENSLGVQAAPELEKKKGKKRKKETDSEGGAGPGKKIKSEGSESDGEVTATEIIALIKSEQLDMKALVSHFKHRIKTKERKASFQATIKSLDLKFTTKGNVKIISLPEGM